MNSTETGLVVSLGPIVHGNHIWINMAYDYMNSHASINDQPPIVVADE